MSEEFDKEAEREKLREKYADDEESRSATQRMSELLLQGATMTNQHCDNCGDPLFRDNGETFCPTCASGEAPEEQQPSGDAADGAQSQPGTEATGAQLDQRPTGTAANADARNRPAGAEQTAPQLPDEAEVTPLAGDQHAAPQPPETQPRTGTPQPPAGDDATGDPRAELRRAVTETARKASAATDPNTARAWLEASKEAAEALSALER